MKTDSLHPWKFHFFGRTPYKSSERYQIYEMQKRELCTLKITKQNEGQKADGSIVSRVCR
jgi:hypothetical protein